MLSQVVARMLQGEATGCGCYVILHGQQGVAKWLLWYPSVQRCGSQVGATQLVPGCYGIPGGCQVVTTAFEGVAVDFPGGCYGIPCHFELFLIIIIIIINIFAYDLTIL